MMIWWDRNVSEKTDEATLRPGITEAMIPAHGAGNSRLASHQYDTLHTIYNLGDEQEIVPCDAAWNEGASVHMDNKPDDQEVNHGGAAGDQGQSNFDAWFDNIVVSMGGNPDSGTLKNMDKQAGGDEETNSYGNLKERVTMLESKLLELERQEIPKKGQNK